MTSHHIAPLLLALGAAGATRYRDNVLSGVGPADTLSLISYAARSLGESSLTLAEPDFQTLPMLFSGGVDGLIEGLTWAAYWTQDAALDRFSNARVGATEAGGAGAEAVADAARAGSRPPLRAEPRAEPSREPSHALMTCSKA